MERAEGPRLPIGYWLKKVHDLLTARIDEAQATHGLTRRAWQILNLLQEMGSASRAQIAEHLRPFADAGALGNTVDSLLEAGLVEVSGPGDADLRLTGRGREVHAAALETQQQIRAQAMDGIREADYEATMRVLQQMARNLTGI